MRKLLFILSVVSLIGIATSCKKDFLNTTPLRAYSDAAVWIDPNLTAAFVNQCYENAIGYPFNITGWESNGSSQDTYHYLWNQLYSNVRACNLFFSKVKTVVFPDDATKTQTIGEVYFLRAYTYHYLVAMYGGVPLITKQ